MPIETVALASDSIIWLQFVIKFTAGTSPINECSSPINDTSQQE
jgi:hypothetical protein